MVILFLFVVLGIRYIHITSTNFCSFPIFERSEFILIMGFLGNYIQSAFNLGSGYIFLQKDSTTSKLYMLTYLPGTYGGRLYASCMAIRIYRIILLNKLRTGNTTTSVFITRSSFKWLLIVTNIYPLLMTILFLLILNEFGVNDSILNYWVTGTYSIEAVILFLLAFKALKNRTHPTILLEYFLSSIIWCISMMTTNLPVQIRWVYVIPIKNMICLFISIVCLYEHCDNIRPPLPENIRIHDIFDLKELYYHFIEYLQRHGRSDLVSVSNLYKEGKKALEFNNFHYFLNKCAGFDVFKEDEHGEFNESLIEMNMNVLCSLLLDVCDEYFNSYDYKEFKKHYFINFD